MTKAKRGEEPLLDRLIETDLNTKLIENQQSKNSEEKDAIN